MKILIKGAGDLASGSALRLFHCGFDIVMTDLPVPTAVRRSVSFSRAVYEGSARVEDVDAVFCKSPEEIREAVESRRIAVTTLPAADILEFWKPEVVADLILAKKNLGTTREDADIVVAAGPGFTAGKDCHCVIETKRGHDLGRCIYEGSALPNTGIPGNIGGFGAERVLRASAAGIFRPVRKIGDLVEAGDICGYAGEEPVKTEISGVVRGLLQPGVPVAKGFKCGDVDPRGEVRNCYTVSDKARAIAGGVLEAILSLRYEKTRQEDRDL